MPFKTKHILGIIGVMISAIALVATLTWIALRPLAEKTGFKRQFANNLVKISSIEKPEDVFDFAGRTSNNIFFKTKNPSRIFKSDYSLTDTQSLYLGVRFTKKIATMFNCIVDSTDWTILAGRIPAVYSGNFNNNKINQFKFPFNLFTKTVKIGANSFVFRGFDSTMNTIDQIFFKGNPHTGKIQLEQNISEKNNDAGISTDGSLLYDTATNYLVYVYKYRNEFICLDTNLNLVHKSFTLNPIFKTSEVKADFVKKQKAITAVTPKRNINSIATVFGGVLYVNSNLKADNESLQDLNDNSIIDAYELTTSAYLSSFYIPKYRGEKMRTFMFIEKNKLLVLYKTYIICYQIA